MQSWKIIQDFFRFCDVMKMNLKSQILELLGNFPARTGACFLTVFYRISLLINIISAVTRRGIQNVSQISTSSLREQFVVWFQGYNL